MLSLHDCNDVDVVDGSQRRVPQMVFTRLLNSLTVVSKQILQLIAREEFYQQQEGARVDNMMAAYRGYHDYVRGCVDRTMERRRRSDRDSHPESKSDGDA
jgi:hypothetical protein